MTLHPSSRVISTYSIPLHDGLDVLDMHFDIEERAVVLQSSDARQIKVDLSTSPTWASFYASFMAALGEFGLQTDFIKTPLDMTVKEPFDQITDYHHYDRDSIG